MVTSDACAFYVVWACVPLDPVPQNVGLPGGGGAGLLGVPSRPCASRTGVPLWLWCGGISCSSGGSRYRTSIGSGDGEGSSNSGSSGMGRTVICPCRRGDFLLPSSARLSARSLPRIPTWDGTCNHCTSAPIELIRSSSCDQKSTCLAGPDCVCHLWRRHFWARPRTPSTT